MDTIGDYRDKARERYGAMLDVIQLHAVPFHRMIELLDEFFPLKPRDYSGAQVRLGYDGGLNTLEGVLVLINLDAAESFKTVQPFLEALMERCGYALRDTSDYVDLRARTYKFAWGVEVEKDGKPATIYATIHVRVFVPSNGEHCKVVEDGMQPKYKLVCSGS